MITIQENISLAPLSTFKIGGNAKYFAVVSSDEEVLEALRYAKEHHLKVFVLGGGSNVLFSDIGFNGLLIKLENANISVSGTSINAQSGATLADVIACAIDHALSGMELMSGIPGSLGGAVRGNAGAFGVEIGSFVTQVKFLDMKTSEVRTIAKEDCGFSYRSSTFKWHANFVVLSAELVLTPGDTVTMNRIARETVAKREAKHPQHLACAGSFFMNPVVPDAKLLKEFNQDAGVVARDGKIPAGWLIDHVDLRGKKIGGARVSDIHPNYIINTGNATAEDVLILASIIKQRVRTQLGIELKEEVQMVGF